MSGWVVPSQVRPTGIQLPPGLRIATTGSRLGAWLLDRGFFFLIALMLGGIALVVGAVDVSPGASDQMLGGTSANLVTVPLLTVNTSLLVAFGVAWVLVQYAYEALSWTFFRGTPGQRILSLRVADAATGRNLTLWQSSLRWLALESVPQIALTVFLVVFVRMMGDVPPSSYGAGALTGSIPTNGTYTTVSLVGDVAILLSVGWRLGLFVITTTHPAKRGLHDRLAGSLVVGRASVASYWAQAQYGGVGGPAGPFAAGGSYGPGYPYGPPAPQVPPVQPPPGQWPPSPGPAMPPPVSAPGGLPQPGETSAPPAGRVSEPDAWAPPSIGWAPPPASSPPPGWVPPPTSGWSQPSVGGSRPTGDPNWWQPLEESAPRADHLSDGTELPIGLRVPHMARRTSAYLIDCAIVYFFYSAWLGVLGYAGGEKQAILAGVIAGIGQLIYFVCCWRLFRGTVGQKILHLQIGDFRTGNALGWGDAFVRWGILQGPFALATVVPGVLYVAIAFGAACWALFLLYDAYYKPDHRAVHDRAVNSLVAQTA